MPLELTAIKRQIIAMGGGGFLMEPENPLLDQYVLGHSGKSKPRICYVGTASGDPVVRSDFFHETFRKYDCETSHLSLFKPPLGSLEEFVLNQDILYVGGGNTRNLMVLWKEWGLDLILRKALDQGIVLCGMSAGSLCWFEQGITDSITGSLTPIECLGFLKGSNCPHYDGEPERRPNYQRLMKEGKLQAGYAADDGVALHFTSNPGENDFSLESIVSSRPDARAYRVSCEVGQIAEEMLIPRYLG